MLKTITSFLIIGLESSILQKIKTFLRKHNFLFLFLKHWLKNEPGSPKINYFSFQYFHKECIVLLI